LRQRKLLAAWRRRRTAGHLQSPQPPRPHAHRRPQGAFRDPCIHDDGKKVLFAYRKGGTHHYNLYEINLDGTGLKQLTCGDWDDLDPCCLPDGDIIFCSTRCQRYVLCWLAPVAVLHRCRTDGSGIRQVSSAAVTENTPAVLPDGQLLYTRWEYVNRATTSFHQLWTMNPDGTGVVAYFGNMHPTGIAYIDARPIPGTDQVILVSEPAVSVATSTGRPLRRWVATRWPPGGPPARLSPWPASRRSSIFRVTFSRSSTAIAPPATTHTSVGVALP